MNYAFIPEAFIALNAEIEHHPLLLQRIQKHPPGETELVLAEIAAYCSVALDDWYNEDDLAKVAHICWERLKATRPAKEIYIPPDDWSKFLELQERKSYEKKKRETRLAHWNRPN